MVGIIGKKADFPPYARSGMEIQNKPNFNKNDVKNAIFGLKTHENG